MCCPHWGSNQKPFDSQPSPPTDNSPSLSLKLQLDLWKSDFLGSFFCLTFNSRWSSKYGLVDQIMPIDGASTWPPKICHSLGRSGLIRSESSPSNWPWLESAVTPSDCLFLLHYCCTRLCQRCTCICVLRPPKKIPSPENRGREPKTRFEDYFTEQLKLLLLHSVCCCSKNSR